MKPSKKTAKKKSSPRITHLEVSRVYNTGNYTNAKFVIGAEVPPGASAEKTLFELIHIVTMLKPFGKPSSMEQLEAARKKPAEDQTNYEKENIEEWAAKSQAYYQRVADRRAALAALDDLGGAIEKRDAKLNWSDYDEDTPW